MSSNTVHQSTIDRNIGNCTIEMLSQTRELLDNASMQSLCGSAVNGNPGVNRQYAQNMTGVQYIPPMPRTMGTDQRNGDLRSQNSQTASASSDVMPTIISMLNSMDKKLETSLASIEGQLMNQNKRWQSIENNLSSQDTRMNNIEQQMIEMNEWKKSMSQTKNDVLGSTRRYFRRKQNLVP